MANPKGEDGVSPISGTAPPISGRWKPGQSGNPTGRPKRKPLTDALLRVLAKLDDSELEELVREPVKRLAAGDIGAFKEIADRVEGKVPQALGGTDELPAIKGFAWIDPTTE